MGTKTLRLERAWNIHTETFSIAKMWSSAGKVVGAMLTRKDVVCGLRDLDSILKKLDLVLGTIGDSTEYLEVLF